MNWLAAPMVDIVGVAIFWLVVLIHWRRAQCPIPTIAPALPSPLHARPPLVSIIVPARNEARHIEWCVRSLLDQDYPNFEVFVVDDCSDDETASIVSRLVAEDGRLRLIRGTPLSPGWMGKAHALYQGYLEAKGDWLLFTDADTVHAPFLLSGVMAQILVSPASFATVLAHQVPPTFGVYLANRSVFTYIGMVADMRGFMDPTSPQSLVNGQYLLFSREAYEAIGTHAAVREYSSTDVSLGYLAKLDGWLPLLLNGRHALRTEMYRTFGEAFHGWSRSLVNGIWTALGSGRGTLALLALVVGLSFFWIVPWLRLVESVRIGSAWAGLVSAAQILAGFAFLGLRRPGWQAVLKDGVLMPIAFLVFDTMAIVGLCIAWVRRGTVWKGRIVQTRKALPRWQPRPPRLRDWQHAPSPSATEAEAAGYRQAKNCPR
jgi:chlorobactene glucosyltransferase